MPSKKPPSKPPWPKKPSRKGTGVRKNRRIDVKPAFELSEKQNQVLIVPEEYNLFLGGGRGGAKTRSMAFLALRHAEQYRQHARILYIRRTYKSLTEFEQLTRDIFDAVYEGQARYNAHEHIWQLPTGSYMELGQYDNPRDYKKYQGRSFTLFMVDEVGHYEDPTWLARLQSNLRTKKGIALRTVYAANPGDPGHSWLAERFVFASEVDGVPFTERVSGKQWVVIRSTYRDNPFIDQEAYEKELRAACENDPELLKAWLDGDWSAIKGAYFASVLSHARVSREPWEPDDWKQRDDWRLYLAHDFGVARPSVTYVVAQSRGAQGPDGFHYPAGSRVLVDELATVKPDTTNDGMGWTVPKLAEAIVELAKRWNMTSASGVADDAIFAKTGSGAGSIADEFRRNRVYFRPAKKGNRVAGWETMRKMMAAARSPDEFAEDVGLYVSTRCAYWWKTVPYLGRDPYKADDVDSSGPDHAADATRYGCISGGTETTMTTLRI